MEDLKKKSSCQGFSGDHVFFHLGSVSHFRYAPFSPTLTKEKLRDGNYPSLTPIKYINYTAL